MNYPVNSFKVCIYKVNPFSWIIRTWKVIRNIFRVGGSWPPHLLSYFFLLRPANSGLFYL